MSAFGAVGPVCFLVIKRPLNQSLVSFGLVCTYVSSLLVWLFRFLCCFLVVVVFSFVNISQVIG